MHWILLPQNKRLGILRLFLQIHRYLAWCHLNQIPSEMHGYFGGDGDNDYFFGSCITGVNVHQIIDHTMSEILLLR